MSDFKLYLPDFIMISYTLQACETISDSARIYCGQLRAIGNRFKYVWSTDDELAELKKKDKRTIQRWHQELEDAGFLSRRSVNKPILEEGGKWHWIRSRKMFIYDTPYDNPEWVKKHLVDSGSPDSLIPPNPLDIPDPSDGRYTPENAPHYPDSNNDCDRDRSDAAYGSDRSDAAYGCDRSVASIIVNSSSKLVKTTEQGKEAVVVNLNLSKLNISAALRNKIISGYTIEEIDIGVKRCLAWKGRPSDDIGIMTVLNRSEIWIDNPTPEQNKELAAEFLRSLMKYDGKSFGLSTITVGTNYIEFVSGMKVEVYNIDQVDFKVKVTEHFEKLKQADEKLKKDNLIRNVS